MLRIVIASSLLAVACGSDKGGSSGEPISAEQASDLPESEVQPSASSVPPEVESEKSANNHSFLVEDSSKLPACDAKGEGWLAYVRAEEVFKVCEAGGWNTIAMGNRIIASIGCHGQLESTNIFFSYSVAQMVNGDVFTTGEIRGSLSQFSSAMYYSAQQQGSKTAPVFITFDVLGDVNAGNWKIELNRDTLVSSIIYYDVDAAGGTMSWIMPADKCVLNRY